MDFTVCTFAVEKRPVSLPTAPSPSFHPARFNSFTSARFLHHNAFCLLHFLSSCCSAVLQFCSFSSYLPSSHFYLQRSVPFSHLQSWMAHVYGPYKRTTSVLCLSHTVCFSVVGPLSSPLHLSAHVSSKPTSDRLLSIQYPSPVKGSQQAPISFKPSQKHKPCVCLPNMFYRWKPSSRTFLDVSFISFKIYIFPILSEECRLNFHHPGTPADFVVIFLLCIQTSCLCSSLTDCLRITVYMDRSVLNRAWSWLTVLRWHWVQNTSEWNMQKPLNRVTINRGWNITEADYVHTRESQQRIFLNDLK